MKVIFSNSNIRNKKMTAVFYDGNKKVKTTHFGDSNGSSFIDHKDEQKKEAWIARHKVRGTFDDPMSASSLSRFVLWNKPTLTASIKDYKTRFNFK